MEGRNEEEVSAPPPKQEDAGPPTSEELPSPSSLERAAGVEVFDMEGKAHSFAQLYSGPDVTSRVLVIFVRHVFCGVSLMTFYTRFFRQSEE